VGTFISAGMVSFFQRYLNALILGSQLSEFPGDLIRSQGALNAEAVSNLCPGKKLGGDSDRNEQTASDDLALKRYELMKKLLNGLQSMGALVGTVRPEFLQSRTDFMRTMRTKVTKQLLGLDYFNAPDIATFDKQMLGEFTSSKAFSAALVDRLQVLESLYANLSAESWMIVLMQVFRCFVIARIDVDKMGSVPGVQDALKRLKYLAPKMNGGTEFVNEFLKPPPNVPQIFSPQELLLLGWVNIHHLNSTTDFKSKYSDFSGLRDSLAFASLLKVHTTVSHGSFNENATDRSQREQNAIELVNCMKGLKLSFCPLSTEIVDGAQCMIATIVGYFYETLPHYLPSMSIEFATPLHKVTQRSITLTNPSRTEIVYRAMLEGDHSFSLVNDSVLVGPSQTLDFPITFLATTVRTVMARLSLIPSRPRVVAQTAEQETPRSSGTRMPQYSAPIIVDLISAVTMEAPDATMEIEAHIYQATTVKLAVKNLLMSPARVALTLQTSRIADENGKPS
jgi:hypothetical protein